MKDIEILHIQQQRTAFPLHYHDTFCISLIHQGVEVLELPDQKLYTKAGQISITNPYEIHANPIGDYPIQNTFTTLYLSPTLVDDLLEQDSTQFTHQQAYNQQLNTLFYHLLSLQRVGAPKQIEKTLKQFLQQLNTNAPLPFDTALPLSKWQTLLEYIETHLEDKLSLEALAKILYMDKYHFAKLFKKKMGLSPMHYVLMKKVFKAKSLLNHSTNLTTLAYAFNFADQAHFSKQFKRFIGLSPKHYQKQLKV